MYASYPLPLRVLFLAAEADPFIKVGGLGDVAGSLPRALQKLSIALAAPGDISEESPMPAIDVRLVIPLHGAIDRSRFELRPVASFNVPYVGGDIPAEVFDTDVDGLPVYLISGPPTQADPRVYTGDPQIDGMKYVFFSLAALHLARALGWRPDLIHANDWHTAPAIYARQAQPQQDGVYDGVATLLGVHNLPDLGVGTGAVLNEFGLPPAAGSALPWWAQDMPLPLGLLAADHIVAVSPTYAREILTPEFGSGLHDFLLTRQDTISGILNGIDAEQWNPSSDPHLVTNYNLQNLPARAANKTALQLELGLKPDPTVPLLAMINRMDNQKGVDLALDALRMLASQGSAPWQAILLGTGLPELEETARRMQADYPDRVRAAILFDAALSRRIYAGADALLIPSRYEPCGLAQMIAMRYGCVPIARATGGLRDTILDYDGSNGTGFLFNKPNTAELAATIRRAMEVYSDKRPWRNLQRQGMQQDFSWQRSAGQYFDLYQQTLAAKNASQS